MLFILSKAPYYENLASLDFIPSSGYLLKKKNKIHVVALSAHLLIHPHGAQTTRVVALLTKTQRPGVGFYPA